MPAINAAVASRSAAGTISEAASMVPTYQKGTPPPGGVTHTTY